MSLQKVQTKVSIDLEQYKKALEAYKNLNSLITTHQKFNRNEIDQEKKSEIDKNLIAQTQTNDGLEGFFLHKQNESFNSKVYDRLLEKESNKHYHDMDNVERERLLLLREKEVDEKLARLLKVKEQLKIRETQLWVKEEQTKAEIMALQKSCKIKKYQLNIESLEKIQYTPTVKQDHQIFSHIPNCEAEENVESLKKRIIELERSNALLEAGNRFYETEMTIFNSEINEQKYQMVKESEKLISRENSLKVREQTLINRENKLVENTKFINAAIKSVNQFIKLGTEKENVESEVENSKKFVQDENNANDVSFRRFTQNLNEIKDISNLLEKEGIIKRQEW